MRERLDEWLINKDYVTRDWAIAYLESRGFIVNHQSTEFIDKSKNIETLYGSSPQYVLALRNLKAAHRQIKHKKASSKKQFSTMISEESHSKIRSISKKKGISISHMLEEIIDKEVKRNQKTDRELAKERKKNKGMLTALKICFYLLKNKNHLLSKQAVDLARPVGELPDDYYEKINHLITLISEEDKEALRKSGSPNLPSYPPSNEEVSILVNEHRIKPPRMFF